MRLRRWIGAAAVAAGTLAASAATANASTPGDGGWQSYPYQPFTEPAGAACSYTLQVTPVKQDVRYLTLASYSNGDPKDQVWAGPLYMRYTNESNGKSMVGDLSGTAYIHYDPDGTQHWYTVGPYGLTFHPDNPYHGAGEYIVGGVSEMVLHGGSVPQLTFHKGPMTDVCAALR